MHPAPPSGHLLLSRVAESAYWAARYLTRAEGTARLVKTHADLIVDLPRQGTVGWKPLLAVVGADDDVTATTEEEVVGLLIADPDNPGSIRACLSAVHRNLRVARVVMPIEAVEILTELHGAVESTATTAIDRRSRNAWLAGVIRSCQTLSAVLNDTMLHDDAFCFFMAGRQLEQADLTTRVLDVQRSVLTRRVDGPVEPYLDLCWYAALRSVSALQPFRRSGIPPSAEATLTFLLRNTRCPRAVETCLLEASRWLLEIPGHEPAMAACAAVQRRLEAIDVTELVDRGPHDAMDDLQAGIANVHDAMAEAWFAPIPAEARR